jgi:hypothetical protein
MSATALAYRGLKDIEEVEPLCEGDRACMEELRAVLQKHGRLDRFGVTLLHAHFPVGEDEVLVETCDSEARELHLRVLPSDEVKHGRIMETAWRLTDGASVTGCYTACVFANGKHTSRHVER